MGTLAADLRAIVARYDGLGYYAGGGDNDADGIPTRADPTEGVGLDCSGFVWLAWTELAAHGHYAGVPPIPLGSTSTYARTARERGYLVPLNGPLVAGDVVIRATNGRPEDSDGPVGHVGIVVDDRGAELVTAESASSQDGVGIYPRDRDFWLIAFRIPDTVTLDPGDFLMALSDKDQAELLLGVRTLIAYNDERSKPPKPTDPPHYGEALRNRDLHAFVSELKNALGATAAKPFEWVGNVGNIVKAAAKTLAG